MIDRVFQHYQGDVKVLIGAHFTQVKALVDAKDNDVILIWLHDSKSKIWYRIYIDATCCAIDKYKTDESLSDIDDGVIFVNYSKWFDNRIIRNAFVESDSSFKKTTLTLNFGDSKCCFTCNTSDEKCELQFI